MKSCIFKGPLKKKIYWWYKKFDRECFSNALREELQTLEGDTFGEFEKKTTNVLDSHAAIKTKLIRFNNNVFMTKELRKKNWIETEIMKIGAIVSKISKISKISDELLSKPSKENKKTWKFKRQECKGQSNFWKTVKPYFNDKGSNSR